MYNKQMHIYNVNKCTQHGRLRENYKAECYPKPQKYTDRLHYTYNDMGNLRQFAMYN